MAYRNFYSDGDTFERNGRTFRVKIEHDDDGAAPWERADGHGPVSDWTRRDKRPGEWVLSSDRNSKRYYDAQDAARLARVDGWGLDDEARAELAAKLGREPKPGEVRAEAVRRDFEFLRRWCADQWHYVGVTVSHVQSGNDESLWGIESDADEYIMETAHELADQIAAGLPPVPDGWDCNEFKIAAHYLPALINGDYTGMTTQECAEFAAWIRGALHGLPSGHWATETDDNGDDFGTCAVSGLKAGRSLVRYVYMIQPEQVAA
jgi:hypothetical protein